LVIGRRSFVAYDRSVGIMFQAFLTGRGLLRDSPPALKRRAIVSPSLRDFNFVMETVCPNKIPMFAQNHLSP